MKIIGIDPGLKGAAAVFDTNTRVVRINKFTNLTDMAFFLQQHTENVGASVMIELVHSMPKDGHVGAFTFGRNVGHYEGILALLGCDVTHVQPSVWQGFMDCLSGGNKNVTKAKAQALFPHIKMTHAIADALLIMEYAARLLGHSTSGKTS